MEIPENTKPKVRKYHHIDDMDESPKNKKPMHKMPSSSSSSCIPEWFLLEILFKLPSKSVFRFKCLSKQVLALISEPYFVRDYISRASSKPLPWTFVVRDMLPADQADCGGGDRRFDHFESNLLDSSPAISFSKLVSPLERCKVEAISNGLCLCSSNSASYFIFNPVTKQSVILPPWSGWRRHHIDVMAFDARVDVKVVGVQVSYKVALLPFHFNDYPTTHLTMGEFSSETHKWTSFTAQFLEPLSFLFSITSFSFKGIFHWVYVSDYGARRIASYDPVHIIRFPEIEDGWVQWCGEIMSGGGNHTISCIIEDTFQGTLYFWRLKDYEQGVWELDHKFERRDILLPCADNKMLTCTNWLGIALHPSQPDLLYLWGKPKEDDEWMPVSFDLRNRNSRVNGTIPRVRDYERLKADFNSICFVLPPWPAVLAHPTNG